MAAVEGVALGEEEGPEGKEEGYNGLADEADDDLRGERFVCLVVRQRRGELSGGGCTYTDAGDVWSALADEDAFWG
jgi:hypothetical protein